MLEALKRRLVGFERTTVVTSFHAKGYEEYGRRFIDSFERCWPGNYDLRIYAEDVAVQPSSGRTSVTDLLRSVPALAEFRARHASNPATRGMAGGRYNYRYDALKFANKSFAIAHAARTCRTRLLVWLDADTVTLKPVPADWIRAVLGADAFVAYLGRLGQHTETGFLAFDLQAPNAAEFFDAFERIYTSDELFQLREWHDCEAFDAVRTTFAALGKIRSRNLSPPDTPHPFVNSVLGEYLDHLKGPERKRLGYSPPSEYRYYRGVALPPPPPNLNAGRYAYIPRLVQLLRPASIVEIGTWSGHRAIQMSRAALSRSDRVHYHGFDLFEDGTPETDAKELNVKPHYSEARVEALLGLFALNHPGFSFTLTKGNTRETLPPMNADFAFIDGGHSVKTIESDSAQLRGCRVVLFDDWYDGPIDTSRFGCNIIVQAHPHLVLPAGDPVAGGGTTRLAVFADAAILEKIRELLRDGPGPAANA